MEELGTRRGSPAPSQGGAPNRPVARGKRGTFARVYFWSIGIFFFLLVLAILITNSLLGDYESSRPIHVAEEVFRTCFVEGDYETLLEKGQFVLSAVETQADFAEHWETMIQAELSFVRVSSDNGETVRYNVRSGEETVAAFELVKSEEKTVYGNRRYELSRVELDVNAKNSVSVLLPSDSTLVVNGVRVPEDYVVERDIPEESAAHMPEGVPAKTQTKYRLDGLLKTPTLSAVSADGREHELVYREETKLWEAQPLYDTELASEMGDYAIKAAQTYAKAMQRDATRAAALSYIDPASELYEQTRNLTLFVHEHSGYHFELVEAGEFVRYDENTFSCRVSFVHVLTGAYTQFNPNGENRENVDITWYFRNVDGTYLIYDRANS